MKPIFSTLRTLMYLFFLLGVHLTCKARGKGQSYGSSGTPQNCLFPFIHHGKKYNGCAGGSFCATKVDSKGNLKNWARCNRYCKKDNGMFFKDFLFFRAKK